MAKKKSKKKTIRKKTVVKKKAKTNSVLAISALVLNIILPGLGSIIAGRTRTGIRQLLLMILVLIAFLFSPLPVVPAVIWAIAWIWGITTGIQLIKS